MNLHEPIHGRTLRAAGSLLAGCTMPTETEPPLELSKHTHTHTLSLFSHTQDPQWCYEHFLNTRALKAADSVRTQLVGWVGMCLHVHVGRS